MKNNQIVVILKKVGAILTNDHFVLTSGRHTSAYINPDKVLPHTLINNELGKLFALLFKNYNIDVVVGPAYGGIIFSQWVAYHLEKLKKRKILSLFTEKTPEKHQLLERGFDKLISKKNILIVEDVTATGSSVVKVINSVKKAGGIIKGVGVIVNRDPEKVNSGALGVPFKSLITFVIESYEAKNCPLCKRGVPVNTKIGHGKKFLYYKK